MIHTTAAPHNTTGHTALQHICTAVLLLLLGACSSNPLTQITPDQAVDTPATSATVSPDTSPEAILLTVIHSLPPGETRTVEGRTFKTGAPYQAASGSECRKVHFTGNDAQAGTTRLACRNSERQFFAADVFSATPEAAHQP